MDISGIDTDAETGTKTLVSANSIADTHIIFKGGTADKVLSPGNSVYVMHNEEETPNPFLTATYQKRGAVFPLMEIGITCTISSAERLPIPV